MRIGIKSTLLCGLLMVGALRASWWQWTRYHEKIALVEQVESNLTQPSLDIDQLAIILSKSPASRSPDSLAKAEFRTLEVTGEFDFENEVVLRNRRFGDRPGVHILTPFKVRADLPAVLVNRGFIPLEDSDPIKRKQFRSERHSELKGIIRIGKVRKFSLAPADRANNRERLDAWLRVNPEAIAKQLAYKLFPFYLEILPSTMSLDRALEQILEAPSGRDEMLILPARQQKTSGPSVYPIPVYQSIFPPRYHLGYVYEWAFLALLCFLIWLLITFRANYSNRTVSP